MASSSSSFIKSEADERFRLPALRTNFVGRHEEIQMLTSLFFVEQKKEVTVCGASGVGKSELAKQFAVISQKEKKVQNIYWINGEREDEFEKTCQYLKYIFEVSKGKRCLFIFDNVDIYCLHEIHLPDEYLYLITCLGKNYDSSYFDLYSIKSSSVDDFYKISLKQYYKNEDYNLYAEIARLVNYVPLGLQVTAASICELKKLNDKYVLETYVEDLTKSYNELTDEKNFPSKEKFIFSAIKICLNMIATSKNIEPDLALDALYICSYLGPKGVNIEMLLNILSSVNGLKTDENVLKEAISFLEDLSLVTVSDANKLWMNQIIQKILRFDELSKILNKYYTACLQFLLKYNNMETYFKSNEGMIFSFLQYAYRNNETFKKFYMKNKDLLHDLSNIKLFDVLLKYLIKYNCENCITHILKNSSRALINKFNLLHHAAYYNKQFICKILLENGLNINSTDENQNTPSHVLSFNWNLNLIKMFIDHGANLYAINKHGNTPIFEFFRCAFKCRNHFNAYINWIFPSLHFLELKNSVNNYGETLLHMACRSLNTELVQILLKDYKFDVNKIDNRCRTPFYAAISVSNEPYATNEKINAMTKVLRRSGAYIGHENMTLFERALESVYRFNILHKLISSNLLEIFDLKLRIDIDINIVDKNLNTLLHTASIHGNIKAIKLLIERSATIVEKNHFGNTPLFEFIRDTYNRKNISLNEVNEIVDLLYCEDTVNIRGETILHVAAASLNIDLINIFITKYKMNANIQTKTGETPLHVLFSKLNEDDITKNLLSIHKIIMLLLLHDASLETKDNHGRTPINKLEEFENLFEHRNVKKMKNILDVYKDYAQHIITNFNLLHIATANNQLDVLKLLLQYKIDVDNKNDNNITPLHLAALHWNYEAINILINHGADVNIRNHQGRKPLHYFFIGGLQTNKLSEAGKILEVLRKKKEDVKNISSEK